MAITRSERPRDLDRQKLWVGKILHVDGQAFRLVKFDDHVTKSGRHVPMAVFSSTCLEDGCGQEIICAHPLKESVFYPARRCSEHRSVGKKV